MNAISLHEENVRDLIAIYHARGTSAVAEALETQLQEVTRQTSWQHFASGNSSHVAEVQVHPNEDKAIDWLNFRFARMGLGRLRFQAKFDSSLPDPTAIDYRKIGPLKWLRYLGGPGVAAVAAIVGLPHWQNASAKDYFFATLPAILIGIASVLLEAQFAWPWLNNLVWKRVHKFGGLIGARFVNITINFFYGMSLYEIGILGAKIAGYYGAQVASPELTFDQAVWAAFMGAWTFDIALGLFQTDIANDEERGSITANTRYGLETTGLIVVNGGRVASWILPPQYGYLNSLVQIAFFFFKTLPQLLKSVVADRMNDRNVFRKLDPAHAPRRAAWEHLGAIFGALQLVNLPRLVRAN